MAKRLVLKEGDVFEIPLENDRKGYFQYICNDDSQLGGNVIRIFKIRYDMNTVPDLKELVSGDVELNTHAIIKFGVKFANWSKIGNVPLEKGFELPWFRISGDDGNPDVKISKDWCVWQTNNEMIDVGELKGKYIECELGPIYPYDEIIRFMNGGPLDNYYPGYE